MGPDWTLRWRAVVLPMRWGIAAGSLRSIHVRKRIGWRQGAALWCMQAQAGDSFVGVFVDAGILIDVEGSDHAPVYADLQLPQPLLRGASAPALDLRNSRTAIGAHFIVHPFAALQKFCNPSSWAAVLP